ncbi:hypothetical protein L3X38_045205 [Prunus dulcis]|uniref:Uncharacterized protein n=1 Tax=Prunus dulcis TaxID=3755 RepID=A0AAD4YP53_PRUDU|nr:hypothetical protein L3X38_045205 [Prunus dulcis]
MFEGILFCLLGGASVTAQFMLQLYVNRLLSKDSSFLFSRAQYALFTEFKDLEPLLKSDGRLMVAFRGNSYIIHRDVTAFGLKPKQDLPLGLPGWWDLGLSWQVGPRACPGCFFCTGGPKPSKRASCPGKKACAGHALISWKPARFCFWELTKQLPRVVTHPGIAPASNSLNFGVPTNPKPVSSQKASCYEDARCAI